MVGTDNMKPLKDALLRMRWHRRQFDQRRAEFYRHYIGQKDPSYFPDGVTKRSNVFVPMPQSNVDTIKARVMDAFFSYDPWFECQPRGAADDDSSEKLQAVMHLKLRQACFMNTFEEWLKNVLIYGHAALKVDWDYGVDFVTKPMPQYLIDPQTQQPVVNPQNGQPVVIGYANQTVPIPRACPKFTAIDIYDLLIDPNGRYIAHMVEKTVGQLKNENMSYAMQQLPSPDGQPAYLYDPEALQQIEQRLQGEDDVDGVIVRYAELWDSHQNTCTLMTFGEDADAIGFKDQRASYRNTGQQTPFKRKVFKGNDIILWQGPNHFAHRRVPIVHTSYSKLPNEIYGLGLIEITKDIVDALNSQVNMIRDNWNLGINRRYAYDVNADIDHEALNYFNVPGGKVGVYGNPANVLMELPTHTPQAGDYMIVDLFKNMVEVASGISDFYSKGIGDGGSNDTATGITSVINESNFKFKDFIRNVETDIIWPVLEMVQSMIQQFITDEIECQITDQPAGIPKWINVHPAELTAHVSYNLVASNYSSSKIVRQRNFMALMQILGQTPFLDTYQAAIEAGKIFEIRNMQRLLKSPEQVAMEQQAQLQQQMQMMMFESMLNTESKARLQQSKPQAVGGGKDGRPRKLVQPEGKMPGAGLEGPIRSMAQNMGMNSIGLEGMGQVPSGQ